MKKQWEKRVDLTIFIYQWILLEYSNDDALKKAFEDEQFDADQMSIVEYLIKEMDNVRLLVEPYLQKSWSWDRMSYLDRAIIIEAIAEAKTLSTPKKVIIDQALITAKNYNIDDTYKYINAILDKVL